MSDVREPSSEGPVPADDGPDAAESPAETGGPVPQRRVSNLLIFSILLSISGALKFLPVIGPVFGLVLAFLGRKKVKQDPNLIGPRFALVCIWFSAVLIPATGYMVYQDVRILTFQVAVGTPQYEMFKAVEAGDFAEAWSKMSEDYRSRVPEEEFEKMWRDLLPADTPVELSSEEPRNPRARDPDIDPAEFNHRLEVLIKEKGATDSFALPWILEVGDEEFEVSLQVHVECLGYAKFDVQLDDLALRVAPPEEQAPGDSGGGDSGRGDPPTDEPK